MKLTDILLRWKVRPPRGDIFRGKYRLIKPITNQTLNRLRNDLEIEEKNMFYLRNPYLTPEQSRGHAVSFKHKQLFLDRMKEIKSKWISHKTLGDRFGFLKVNDKWE